MILQMKNKLEKNQNFQRFFQRSAHNRFDKHLKGKIFIRTCTSSKIIKKKKQKKHLDNECENLNTFRARDTS